MSASSVTVSLSLSEDEKTATIRIGSRRLPIVCNCLGVEREPSGEIKRAYLDSFVHNPSKDVIYTGYSLSGAISTIINRIQSK